MTNKERWNSHSTERKEDLKCYAPDKVGFPQKVNAAQIEEGEGRIEGWGKEKREKERRNEKKGRVEGWQRKERGRLDEEDGGMKEKEEK